MNMNTKCSLIALLFLFCFTQARADVVINETNFPDGVFRNYLMGKSYGKDGVITDDEIASITEIWADGTDYTKIYDLKGIEFFTSLKTLKCRANRISILDISKNTLLEKLICDYNKLISLDVSNNTALTEVNCEHNELTSLDFSNNSALYYLNCSENKLTSLNISKNTALKILRCESSKLTSLDVSNNVALEELHCGDNLLTSIDVSNNKALKWLSCYINKLASLDLSKNTDLKQLSCAFNQLTHLIVSSSSRPSLDMSIYRNKIKGTNMDEFVESLPKVEYGDIYLLYNSNEYFDLDGNEMTTTQVEAAKAKGFRLLYYNGWGDFIDYPGSEPSEIGNIVIDDDKESDIYTIKGQRVKSAHKGMNIIRTNNKTRKIIVK